MHFIAAFTEPFFIITQEVCLCRKVLWKYMMAQTLRAAPSGRANFLGPPCIFADGRVHSGRASSDRPVWERARMLLC